MGLERLCQIMESRSTSSHRLESSISLLMKARMECEWGLEAQRPYTLC